MSKKIKIRLIPGSVVELAMPAAQLQMVTLYLYLYQLIKLLNDIDRFNQR